MTKKGMFFSVLLFSAFLIFAAFSQENQEAQGEGVQSDVIENTVEAESDVSIEAVEGASEAEGGENQEGLAETGEEGLSAEDGELGQIESSAVAPMGPLFFNRTQRRILEVVRRGILKEEEIEEINSLQEDRSGPLILIEEVLSEEEEVAPTRSDLVRVNAFVRNRSNGKTSLWLNGKPIVLDSSEGKQDIFLVNNGLTISAGIGEGNIIEGGDEYSRSRFKVKVGQVIGIDGHIDEGLPVIIRKSR